MSQERNTRREFADSAWHSAQPTVSLSPKELTPMATSKATLSQEPPQLRLRQVPSTKR